jgi:hypothetical protein
MPILYAAHNAFQDILSDFLPAHDPSTADLFSRAVVETYDAKVWTEWGYQFTQVFEPGVLREVALLGGIDYGALQSLERRSSPALVWLGACIDSPNELSFVEKLNVAFALISVSRFDSAKTLVEYAAPDACSPRDRFELGWAEFLISNRCDDGARSPQAFRRMRAAIDEGVVPRARVLDACTQGIVWRQKRREIPDADYAWCLTTGSAIVGEGTTGGGAVSSWYRGLAMVPAAKGDASLTHDYMRRAEAAALESYAVRPTAFELNAIKTFYESTIKEHMYVTKNLEGALAAAEKLIALDPNWSPSFGEMADANRHFGRLEEAAALYEHAARMGPPYVGHHLLQAARCRATLNALDEALAHYETLSVMAPDYVIVREEAQPIAERASETARLRYWESIQASRLS